VAVIAKSKLPLVFGMFMYEGDPTVLRMMLSTAPALPRLLMPRIAPGLMPDTHAGCTAPPRPRNLGGWLALTRVLSRFRHRGQVFDHFDEDAGGGQCPVGRLSEELEDQRHPFHMPPDIVINDSWPVEKCRQTRVTQQQAGAQAGEHESRGGMFLRRVSMAVGWVSGCGWWGGRCSCRRVSWAGSRSSSRVPPRWGRACCWRSCVTTTCPCPLGVSRFG